MGTRVPQPKVFSARLLAIYLATGCRVIHYGSRPFNYPLQRKRVTTYPPTLSGSSSRRSFFRTADVCRRWSDAGKRLQPSPLPSGWSTMEEERKNNKRWYFTREQLENSPSRRFGLDPDKELSYRQQAANLLQDMGQRLYVYPCGLGLRSWNQSRLALASRPQALWGDGSGGRGWAEAGCWVGETAVGPAKSSVFARGRRGGINFPLAHRCHQPCR